MGPLPLRIYKHQRHIPNANEASFYIIGDPPRKLARTRLEFALSTQIFPQRLVERGEPP